MNFELITHHAEFVYVYRHLINDYEVSLTVSSRVSTFQRCCTTSKVISKKTTGFGNVGVLSLSKAAVWFSGFLSHETTYGLC